MACSNNEYVNVIPKNAKAVIEVNMESLFGDIEKPDQIINKLHYLTKWGVPDSDTEFFSLLLNAEEKNGIELEDPFYLYVLPGDYYGATFKVDDVDDVDEFFKMLNNKNLCGQIIEKDDRKWTEIKDDLSVVYNEHVLSVLYSDKITETMNMQSKLLSFEKNDAFINSDKFEKMKDMEGAVKWVFNSDFFYDFNKQKNDDYLNNLKAFLPEGTRPQDVAVSGGLIVEKGLSTINLELFSTNKKIQKILEKEDDKYLKIKGDFIGAPNDFTCWIGLGANGNDLVYKLKQFDDVKKYLNLIGLAIDIETVIKAIKGDLAVVIPGNTDNNNDFIITAKLKNDDFLKSVSLWNDQMVDYGMKMDENAKNNFTLYADSLIINWGVENNNVYFASGNSFYKSAFAEKSDKLDDVKKDIKESVLYVYVNVESIMQKIIKDNEKAKKNDVWEYFAVSADNYRQYKISFVMKDHEKNVLQVLSEII